MISNLTNIFQMGWFNHQLSRMDFWLTVDFSPTFVKITVVVYRGQHSFYQLMHQGRVVPSHFIGFAASQNPVPWRSGKPLFWTHILGIWNDEGKSDTNNKDAPRLKPIHGNCDIYVLFTFI